MNDDSDLVRWARGTVNDHGLEIDKDLAKLRQAGAYPFVCIPGLKPNKEQRLSYGCFKCDLASYRTEVVGPSGEVLKISHVESCLKMSPICMGRPKSLWTWLLGLFGKRICTLDTFHFHITCKGCGFEYIMAPKDKKI